MKVLLIEPAKTVDKISASNGGLEEVLFFPLGLGYLYKMIKNSGYEVEFLDCYERGYAQKAFTEYEDKVKVGLSDSEIKGYIEKFKPDVVGVSCIISNRFYDVLNIFKIVKRLDKRIITVIGGGHATILVNDTLNYNEIDFVIRGEGEKSFINFLKWIENGRDEDKVPKGVALKSRNGQVISSEPDYVECLDDLPFPAYKEMNYENYLVHNDTASIITSRGCLQRCIFCLAPKIWGNKYRTRSVENVLAEIKFLSESFNIKHINFLDDNFLRDKTRAKKIFKKLIETKYLDSWVTEHGIEPYLLDKEIVELMAKSGCKKIGLAIESGDQWVLNNVIKKPVNLDRVKEIVKYIKMLNINVRGFFIMGLPGEKIENIENTIKYAKELELDSCAFFSAIPIPGTDLYDICAERGYLQKDNLEFLKYNFSTVNIETEDFKKSDIARLLQKARSYYKN